MRKHLDGTPLPAPPAGSVATEVRLFTFGDNPTEKGVFVLTPEDAKATYEAWKARGTDLSWDYSHDEANPIATGPRMAAAWCKLEVRPDGLWATNIQWTDRALKLLASREYRYFSPFFDHDEDGHISNIINVALTNIPATHGIAPIAASAKSKTKTKTTSAWGRLCEVPRAKRPQTLGAPAPSRKKTMGKSKAEALAELNATMAECKAAIKVLAGISDGDGAEGVPARGKVDAGDDSDSSLDAGDDSDTSSALDGDTDLDAGDDSDSADAGDDSDSAGVPPQFTKKAKAAKTSKASRLSLADLVADVLPSDPTAAKAELLAMMHARDRVAALSAKVGALESEQRKTRVAQLLSQAKRDRKISPAMAGMERHLIKIGMRDPSELREILATMPALVTTSAGQTRAAEGTGSAQTLSNLERKIALATGIAPEEFLKQKAYLAANPPPAHASQSEEELHGRSYDRTHRPEDGRTGHPRSDVHAPRRRDQSLCRVDGLAERPRLPGAVQHRARAHPDRPRREDRRQHGRSRRKRDALCRSSTGRFQAAQLGERRPHRADQHWPRLLSGGRQHRRADQRRQHSLSCGPHLSGRR